MRTRVMVGIVTLLGAGIVAEAQPAPDSIRTSGSDSATVTPVPAMGTWVFAPFLGGAYNSPAGYNWGLTPDRNHLLVGLHMATPVLRFRRLTLMYAPNVVPLIVVSNNPRYETLTSGGVPRRVERGRGPVFGIGLVPFGLQLETPLAASMAIYSMAGLGGTYFSDVIPQDGARRFNFSIEFGGGLIHQRGSRPAMILGYKFYHLSNMFTARENPGVDGHVFYLGTRWQKRLPRE